MSTATDQDYELEERAAIREIDGGMPANEANFYARLETDARSVQDNIGKRRHGDIGKVPEQKQPVTTNDKEAKTEINVLRERRDLIGTEVRAETDPQIKDKLFSEWQELNEKILKLRKGLRNDNAGRLSG